MDYKTKYLKYKLKYNELKKQFGGTEIGNEIYNFNNPSDSWGKIIEERIDAWILESGKKVLKKNENEKWGSRPAVQLSAVKAPQPSSQSTSQLSADKAPQPSAQSTSQLSAIKAPQTHDLRVLPQPTIQSQMEFDYSLPDYRLTDYKIYKVEWGTPSKHQYSQWDFMEVRAKIVNALSREDAIRIASKGENNNHTIICELLGKSYFHGNLIFSTDAYYQNA
jgi:hypothetical protein